MLHPKIASVEYSVFTKYIIISLKKKKKDGQLEQIALLETWERSYSTKVRVYLNSGSFNSQLNPVQLFYMHVYYMAIAVVKLRELPQACSNLTANNLQRALKSYTVSQQNH